MLRSFALSLLLAFSAAASAVSVTHDFNCTEVPGLPKEVRIVTDVTEQAEVETIYFDGVKDSVTTKTGDKWVTESQLIDYVMKSTKNFYPAVVSNQIVHLFTGTINTKPVKLPISGSVTLKLLGKSKNLRRFSMKFKVKLESGKESHFTIPEWRFSIDERGLTTSMSEPSTGWSCNLKIPPAS